MLLSILVYGLLGLSLWWLGVLASKRERLNRIRNINTSFWTWEILLSLLLFGMISGLRWNVGTDHLSYLRLYEDLLNGVEYNSEDMEIGFLFISSMLSKAGFHFSFYFGILAVIQLIFVYYAFKEHRYVLPYLGLLILFGGQYHLWMNGIRQTIAACIIVLSVQYITNRNPLKYFLVVLVATLFHKSAIILIVLYAIPNVNYFLNRYITTAILILSVYIGFNPYWITVNDSLVNILNIVGYENYSSRLEYFIVEKQEYLSFGPRRILTLLLNIVMVWLFYDYYKKTNNNLVLLFFNLSIIGAIMFNLFANAGHIFLRPTYYLTIFTPIVSSILLSYYSYNRTSRILTAKFLLLFILSISYLIIAIYADADKYDYDYTNYKFFWDYY